MAVLTNIMEKVREDYYTKIELNMNSRGSNPPKTLVIVQIGSDTSADIYTRQIVKKAATFKIPVNVIKCNPLSRINDDWDWGEVVQILDELNTDRSVGAILLQRPIQMENGSKNDSIRIMKELDSYINLEKNVDPLQEEELGVTATVIRDIVSAETLSSLIITTNADGESMYDSSYIIPHDKVLLLGNGTIVRQLKNYCNTSDRICAMRQEPDMLPRDYEFIMDKDTPMEERVDLDLVITGTGVPLSLKPDDIVKSEKGVMVIDVGVHEVDGKLVGDFDSAGCEDREDIRYTPVPGGVGPLTVLRLLVNATRPNDDCYED